MTEADDLMAQINEAIALLQSGDGEAARRRFGEIWAGAGSEMAPFPRCVLAHYMADAQDDPLTELAWDLRALEAANSATDEQVKDYHASLSVHGFYPSLHLKQAK
jgi:hypothetical protein